MADWFDVLFPANKYYKQAQNLKDEMRATPVGAAPGQGEFPGRAGPSADAGDLDELKRENAQGKLQQRSVPLVGTPGMTATPAQRAENTQRFPPWIPERHINNILDQRDVGQGMNLHYRNTPTGPRQQASTGPFGLITPTQVHPMGPRDLSFTESPLNIALTRRAAQRAPTGR